MKIDRTALKYALMFVSKAKLAQIFGISIPTLRRYIKGEEPVTQGITEKINRELSRLNAKKPVHPHPEFRKP